MPPPVNQENKARPCFPEGERAHRGSLWGPVGSRPPGLLVSSRFGLLTAKPSSDIYMNRAPLGTGARESSWGGGWARGGAAHRGSWGPGSGGWTYFIQHRVQPGPGREGAAVWTRGPGQPGGRRAAVGAGGGVDGADTTWEMLTLHAADYGVEITNPRGTLGRPWRPNSASSPDARARPPVSPSDRDASRGPGRRAWRARGGGRATGGRKPGWRLGLCCRHGHRLALQTEQTLPQDPEQTLSRQKVGKLGGGVFLAVRVGVLGLGGVQRSLRVGVQGGGSPRKITRGLELE